MGTVKFTVVIKGDEYTDYELQGLLNVLCDEINAICDDTSAILNTNLVVSIEKGEEL